MKRKKLCSMLRKFPCHNGTTSDEKAGLVALFHRNCKEKICNIACLFFRERCTKISCIGRYVPDFCTVLSKKNQAHNAHVISLPLLMIVMGTSFIFAGCGDKQKVENEKSYRQIGLEQLAKGDYESAINAFNQALNERTGKVTNLEEDINFYKAYAQVEAGRTKDAIDTYTSLIEYDKKNADAYYLRGCAYISTGDTQHAAEDFKQAAEYNEKSGEMYAGIYEQLISAGMLDDAAVYLDKGLQLEGDSAADHLSRGRLYLASGAYEKAAEELKKSLDKKNTDAYLYLGETYRALGSMEEARNYYQTYAKEHPEDTKVLYELGEMEFGQGAYEEALSYFEQGLSVGGVANKRQLWSGKIAALEYMGDFAGAKQEIEAYLESFPEDEEAQKEYIFLKTR